MKVETHDYNDRRYKDRSFDVDYGELLSCGLRKKSLAWYIVKYCLVGANINVPYPTQIFVDIIKYTEYGGVVDKRIIRKALFNENNKRASILRCFPKGLIRVDSPLDKRSSDIVVLKRFNWETIDPEDYHGGN